MHSKLTRLLSGTAACAIAAGTATVLLASPAAAVHAAAGTTTIVDPVTTAPLNSGDGDTPFRTSLPVGSSCTGDSTNSGYRIQTYVVPSTVDLDTLTFGGAGPTPVAGQFRAPLFDTGGSAFVNRVTANQTVSNGPGQIVQPLPDFSFGTYDLSLGFPLPTGTYNVGIACTKGPVGPTQLDKYFNSVMTVESNPNDPGTAKISWYQVAAVPAAPNLTSVSAGNGTLTATYTVTRSAPLTTGYTVTATPTAPAGPPVVVPSASPTSTTITGLTNGTAYDVTVTATNPTGTSAPSNVVSGTPVQPASPGVTGLTATPGTGSVNLSWTAPADAGPRPPTGYSVSNTPAGGTTTVTGTTASVTGLTAGTLYTFTVTPTYASGPAGTPATVSATPLAAQVLLQNLTVTRPNGALVFTQVCSTNGAIAAEAASTGFPAGLPAVVADGTGFAPTLTGGAPDPLFPQYPYPVDAVTGEPNPNYPTNCGVDLGIAKLVTSGAGAGQFFAASAVLNQVTVVDTRDTDIGWTANGTMGSFTAGAGKTFSGSQLGWTPVMTSDTGSFTDSDGNVYDQTVTAGPVVAPNTPNATGMSSGRALGTAAANVGLGIAQLDARLKLLIPITAKSGNYTGTLTISAV